MTTRSTRPIPAALRVTGIAVLVVLLHLRRADAQTPATIYACIRQGSAQMRLVTAGEACQANEVRIQWAATGQRGPVGPAGPAGPQGPQGPVGAAGTRGAAGPQGPVGAVGAQGVAGAAGTAGPQGPEGPQGALGDQGPQGAAGVVGPQGPQGDKGALGDQGPQGVAGAAGPQGGAGPVGPVGAAGPLGAAGAQGPAGVAGGVGPQGPTGFQGATVQGPVGPAGVIGVAGRDGTRLPGGAIAGSLVCTTAPVPAGTLAYVPGRAFTAYPATDGSFRFSNVPAGTYAVAVSVPGGSVVTVNGVTVATGVATVAPITACPPPSDLGPCGVCGGSTPICNIWEPPYNQCVMCVNNNECYDPLASECIANMCEGLGF